MKKLLILTLVIFFLIPLSASAEKNKIVPFKENPTEVRYVPNQIIVNFHPQAGKIQPLLKSGIISTEIASLNVLRERFKVSQINPLFPGSYERKISSLSGYYTITFDPSFNLDEVVSAYEANPLVEHVEKIAIHTIYASYPNDYYFGPEGHPTFPYYQWYHNISSDHDMDSPEGWDFEKGDSSVVIAILDTGVRYFHKDLGGPNASYSVPKNSINGNIWINWTEYNGTNGVDDDANGFVDDWVGWDWVNVSPTFSCSGEDYTSPDNDPRDFNGHGTHVSGLASAITNNARGVAGFAGGWGDGTTGSYGDGAKIMCLRIGWSECHPLYGELGYVRMDFATSALYYAADMGAKIVNASWGSSYSASLEAAVNYFLASGGFIAHAAGNDNNESADYLAGRTEVLTVAATDSFDVKASFSSYGSWVDVSAPGVDIISLFHSHDDPANDYVAVMSGTSMSSPLAAGLAGLVWSQNPSWTRQQVFDRIVSTADNIDALNPGYAGKLGSGRINAYNALMLPCDVVANFSGTPTSGCAPLTVQFTDLSTGPVISWDWDFGDGTPHSSLQNPSHQYQNTGSYTVTLTVYSATCSDPEIKTDYLQVNTAPIANFSGNPVTGCAPLTVNFTDLSTGNPTSWDWDFGDGTPHSYVQNPTHTYGNTGDYTVTLIAANVCGSDSEVKANFIHVDPPCGAKSYANQDIPVTGTVSGNYTNTHTSDNIYESITEVSSGGKPSSRYSLLEHKWTFDVTVGETITFYVEAYRPANSDNDDFRFEYSRDNVTYYPILTVNSATEMVYSAGVPNTLSGTVYVRVVDTDRTAGRLSYDVIYIDEMYFESVGTPPPPGKMHVDHIDVTTSTSKNGKTNGVGVVWVVDALGNPVADATVYGTWQGLNSTSGVTNAQGKATLESSQVRNACQWFKLCVDNISKSGWTYDSGANVETCDSSYYCGTAKLAGIPTEFSLSQNSPNPFNLSTSISFSLPTPSEVNLTVYNILGEKVRTVAGGWYEAGSHTVTWDGTNESGSVVASGIYFYKLQTDKNTVVKKMSLLK